MAQETRSALEMVEDELRAREAHGHDLTYYVPAAWTAVNAPAAVGPPKLVNPYQFLREHVEAIGAVHPAPGPPASKAPGEWVRDAVIYNMFVRLTSAYDHAHDGVLGTPSAASTAARTLNAQGVRESGTFLKSIALLGHARSLGANTVHLLPITAVGRFGNKGNLGSPYAIRNPYALEPTLADPLIAADADTQFRAFVEACHRLGMRVVTEFVFRTSSRDADMVKSHPDWYYWIRRDVDDRKSPPPNDQVDEALHFGPPPFSADDLVAMKEKVEAGDFTDLPAPPQWYRNQFTVTPSPDRIEQESDGRWVGLLEDGMRVHVPSAFADWPPDDLQPPWTDVTYLRVYNEPKNGPDFNYVAYNTIRMYDTALARPENANTALWDAVRGILPHYQKQYGIDGCMVDMGHALPPALMQSIIEQARANHPDFALLSENFVVDESSVKTGYNAVLGYEFTVLSSAAEMRALIERTCVQGLPIAAFGSGETHNTPRVAMRGRGPRFCRAVWLINCFLPDTIPFIHSGFELGEEHPVNLGLAFTEDEMLALRHTPLGLFDLTALSWDRAALLPLEMAHIAALRQRHLKVAQARGPASFAWLDVGDEDNLLAFKRVDPASGETLYVVADWACDRERQVIVETGAKTEQFHDLLGHRTLSAASGRLSVTLAPGEGSLFSL